MHRFYVEIVCKNSYNYKDVTGEAPEDILETLKKNHPNATKITVYDRTTKRVIVYRNGL